MKRVALAALALSVLLALLSGPWAAPAADQEMLQVTALQGRLLDPQGRELAEYDYLEASWKCRLMPGAEVELSTLDGQAVYRAQGPGIVEFDGAQAVTLNGKPLARSKPGGEEPTARAEAGASPKLGALVMRSVEVQAKTKSGETKSLPLYSGYHALVIGVGEYNQGWPGLPNPVRDAHEVAELLQGMGWQVEMVENPDGELLRKSLNSLITGPGRDEEKAVLIWFSGHGHTLGEADGSELGYIVPVDAPDPGQDEMGFMERAVSMRQVETVARRIRSKHVLMIFDSCFSGAIFQTTRAAPPPFIEEKVAQPVRQFITAGNENEQVPDRSYFKTVFIQGVGQAYADRNKDGYVTGQELGAYLQENVINYSKKAQHPQFGKINNPKLDKGDFVFVVHPQARGETRVASVETSAGPKVVDEKKLTGRVEVTGNVDRIRFELAGTWFETKIGAALVIGQVPVGEHQVRAQKEGYEDWLGKVVVRSEGAAALDIRLEELSGLKLGKARIAADQGGVKVSLAGFSFEIEAGKAVLIGDIPAGEQEMSAVKPGFKTWNGILRVKADETTQVFIQMEPEKALTSTDGKKEKIAELLAWAEEHLLAYRYTTPETGNALDMFNRVLALDPENKEAQVGLRRIVNSYIALADKQIKAGRLERASRYLERGRSVLPDFEGLKAAQERLEQAREAAKTGPATSAAGPAKPSRTGQDSRKVVISYRTRSRGSHASSLMMMTLTFLGDRVEGVYDGTKGRLAGRLREGILTGSWSNDSGKPSGGFPEGDFRFQFSPDRKSFWGSWDIGGDQGRWDGFEGHIEN